MGVGGARGGALHCIVALLGEEDERHEGREGGVGGRKCGGVGGGR